MAELENAKTKQQPIQPNTTEAALKFYQAGRKSKASAIVGLDKLTYFVSFLAGKVEVLGYVVGSLYKIRKHYLTNMPPAPTADLVKEVLGECLEAFDENLQDLLEQVILTQGKKVYKQLQAAQTNADVANMTDEQKKKQQSFGAKVSGAFGSLKEFLSDKIMPYSQGQNLLSMINLFTGGLQPDGGAVNELFDFFDAVHASKPQKLSQKLAEFILSRANHFASSPGAELPMAGAPNEQLTYNAQAVNLIKSIDNKAYVKSILALDPIKSVGTAAAHRETVHAITRSGRVRYKSKKAH